MVEKPQNYSLETGKYKEAVSTVYGMNRRMDKGIQRVIEALESCGLAENTLLVFASDNGPDFGPGMALARYNGYFNGCKGTVYEGGIRVPAFVRWPSGLEPGRRCDDLTHFTDWLPTLLTAAGAKGLGRLSLDGQDILPVLRGERGATDTCRFWQWNRYTPVRESNAAMRDGPWKLIRPIITETMELSSTDVELDRRYVYEPQSITEIQGHLDLERALPPAPPPLLFNIDQDPYEQNDLAETHSERVGRMQAELDRWFESVEADRRTIDDSLDV